MLCERGGPYFMAATETLRQMWPGQPFPPSLALEAFYLELRSFDMRVGFCPGSILRSNVIRAYNPSREVDAEACDVFGQPLDALDELSKKWGCGGSDTQGVRGQVPRQPADLRGRVCGVPSGAGVRAARGRGGAGVRRSCPTRTTRRASTESSGRCCSRPRRSWSSTRCRCS